MQRLVTVEFLLSEDEDDEPEYLSTRTDIAKVLQDWFDDTGGFGGNFHVASMESLNDEQATRWFEGMNN